VWCSDPASSASVAEFAYHTLGKAEMFRGIVCPWIIGLAPPDVSIRFRVETGRIWFVLQYTHCIAG
jgi:hypothetical protein